MRGGSARTHPMHLLLSDILFPPVRLLESREVRARGGKGPGAGSQLIPRSAGSLLPLHRTTSSEPPAPSPPPPHPLAMLPSPTLPSFPRSCQFLAASPLSWAP